MNLTGSSAVVRPRRGTAVDVGHHAVERSRVVVEDQRQKVTVTRPHGQWFAGPQQPVDGHPVERSVVVTLGHLTGEGVNDEQEAEPVFAAGPSPWPRNGAAQPLRGNRDAGLFHQFAMQATDHVLVGFELAADLFQLKCRIFGV